ncbi:MULTISPECIES: hypothetical protein [unclassified Mesorhizobium]|uniref:hypothetical protein n=1 Tax=unclassified Mesorhizobium TaxID=325217 RepID=UPI00241695AC|nr:MULTISPECIES: hypothetical protein [unclassified Mesorhizobium]MDG4900575.1 hypothetical protein [Mesorhizobium sp. WSM4962]MDG4917188.1 hypothetical protein [Mesorhizobium sp. WSM4989]
MANESTRPTENGSEKLVSEAQARRDFLKQAGRFAAVTPPAITILLGTSLNSRAIAKSGGTRPGNGWGDKNHIHLGSGSGYKPKLFKSGNGKLFKSDNGNGYGGGPHGGSK